MRWNLAAALAPTVVVLAVLLAASGPASADLTGKWQIENNVGEVQFVDVIDVAGSISMTLSGIALTGTLVGSELSLSTPCPPPSTSDCSLNAVVYAGEEYFDGFAYHPFERVLANRCECFDGNTLDGDGCDATCRVEACFTCTGMPSSCIPTPDGGSCSDGADCTTGETCTAGICSGSPVASCVDLSGLWVTTVEPFPSNPYPLVSGTEFVQIEQRDGFALIRNFKTGRAEHFGTIDPDTGAFSLEYPNLANCGGFAAVIPLSGNAALDNMSFAATGTRYRWNGPASCVDYVYTRSGTRTDAATAASPITVTVNFNGTTTGSLTFDTAGDLRPSSCSFRHGSDHWDCNDTHFFGESSWVDFEVISLDGSLENDAGCGLWMFAEDLALGYSNASHGSPAGCNEATEELPLGVPTMTSAMAAAVPGLALIGVSVLTGVLGAAGYRKLRDQNE
jgi:cysteine-rich repeat protein